MVVDYINLFPNEANQDRMASALESLVNETQTIGTRVSKAVSDSAMALTENQNRNLLFTESQEARTTIFNASEASRTITFEESEALRELAESSRVTAESGRVSAEEARTNTFNTFILNADSEINTSEANALNSANTANQAMSDLLAMIGSDIATLGADGKISASQLPALAINDTFTINSKSELTALTAQRGDVAIHLISETVSDAYMLTADNPTVEANWVQLGVSYVAEAGHANTATMAEDSQKINGHRVVAMNQAQYDLAVKDPDTVYLVAEV